MQQNDNTKQIAYSRLFRNQNFVALWLGQNPKSGP